MRPMESSTAPMAIDRFDDLIFERPPRGPTYRVAGLPVSAVNLAQAIDRIVGWARVRRGRYVCVRDLHGLALALEDPLLMRIHDEADMVTPDGMPLVWVGRARGLPIGRACGSDLMAGVIASSESAGLSQFFLGGRPGVAARLSRGFVEKYPLLRIAGHYELPFAPIDEYDLDAIVERVNSSRAHVVWVGLSTPKQEQLMYRIARRTKATFIGVGAAFDFHCGDIKRAPAWMQRIGLEWAFRISQDPGRLGPRYLGLIVRLLMLNFKRRAD